MKDTYSAAKKALRLAGRRVLMWAAHLVEYSAGLKGGSRAASMAVY